MELYKKLKRRLIVCGLYCKKQFAMDIRLFYSTLTTL